MKTLIAMSKYKPKSVDVHETDENYRIILEYEKPLFKNIDVFERELRGQYLTDSVRIRKGDKTIKVVKKLPKNINSNYVKVYQGDPNTLLAYEPYTNEREALKAIRILERDFPHCEWEVEIEEYETYGICSTTAFLPRRTLQKRYYIVGKLETTATPYLYRKLVDTYNDGDYKQMGSFLEELSGNDAKEILGKMMEDLYKKYK